MIFNRTVIYCLSLVFSMSGIYTRIFPSLQLVMILLVKAVVRSRFGVLLIVQWFMQRSRQLYFGEVV